MEDWSGLGLGSMLMPEEIADASSGLQSSVVAKIGCVGFTFYTGVFKVTKYIHQQLHYESWQCIWREFVLCCLREHLFFLGDIFSENLWLTEAFAFVAGPVIMCKTCCTSFLHWHIQSFCMLAMM
jgi:hypothetical protein